MQLKAIIMNHADARVTRCTIGHEISQCIFCSCKLAMHSCDTTILIPQEDEASVELELYVTETDQDQQAGSMLDKENKPEQKGHRL